MFDKVNTPIALINASQGKNIKVWHVSKHRERPLTVLVLHWSARFPWTLGGAALSRRGLQGKQSLLYRCSRTQFLFLGFGSFFFLVDTLQANLASRGFAEWVLEAISEGKFDFYSCPGSGIVAVPFV